MLKYILYVNGKAWQSFYSLAACRAAAYEIEGTRADGLVYTCRIREIMVH